MKAKELIEILSALHDDTEVMVQDNLSNTAVEITDTERGYVSVLEEGKIVNKLALVLYVEDN